MGRGGAGASVTVVIVNYFTSRMVQRAVESVWAATGVRDVVVVDNSVSPHERRQLGRMEPPKTPGPSLHLLWPKKNLGFGRACNWAAGRYPADYFLLLNPDAYLRPGALERMVAFMEEAKRAGAASPMIYLDDALLLRLPPSHLPGPWDLVLERLGGAAFRRVRSRLFLKKSIGFWRSPRPVVQSMLSGGVLLVRKEAVDGLGQMFDEDFFLYFEDADLCKRLRRAGWRLFAIPDAEAVHHYDQAPGAGHKAMLFREAQAVYWRKHHPLLWRLVGHLAPSTPPVLEGSGNFVVHRGEPPTLRPDEASLCGDMLLLISPNPDLFPSGAIFCKGAPLRLPHSVWRRLKKGKRYFYRFVPADSGWPSPARRDRIDWRDGGGRDGG